MNSLTLLHRFMSLFNPKITKIYIMFPPLKVMMRNLTSHPLLFPSLLLSLTLYHLRLDMLQWGVRRRPGYQGGLQLLEEAGHVNQSN
jgi:hypothetical protein